MSTPNHTAKTSPVYIYVLQRISDKVYLYIGSAKNPRKRFCSHRRKNTYAIIRDAFLNNDIRFLIITETDEDRRIETETQYWKSFKDAGHPIVNRNPSIVWTKHLTNKGRKFGPVSAERSRKIGEANKRRIVTQETKRKIGDAHRGKTRDVEEKRKQSISNKGKTLSEEHKNKIGKSNTGKHRNDEFRQKMSEIAQNRPPMSEETKQKIGIASKGHPVSLEQRAQISATHIGKEVSEETRRKMSESAKARYAKKRESQ